MEPQTPPAAPNGVEESTRAESRSSSSKTVLYAIIGSIAAVLVLIAVFTSAESGPESDALSGEIADLTFVTTDGETSTLADFRGEPLVVNFFASWCAPCRAELPEFEEVHKANLDAGVRFVGISHDIDEATWRTFVSETEITFETVYQPQEDIWRALDGKGMPTTVFLSEDGTVMETWGGILSAELLQEKIDTNLLGET